MNTTEIKTCNDCTNKKSTINNWNCVECDNFSNFKEKSKKLKPWQAEQIRIKLMNYLIETYDKDKFYDLDLRELSAKLKIKHTRVYAEFLTLMKQKFFEAIYHYEKRKYRFRRLK